MRLIDADASIESIKNLLQNGATIEQAIDAQPTAYDVKKVVEQLEERLPFCPTNQTDTLVEYELLEAIGIVKAGGVDGN